VKGRQRALPLQDAGEVILLIDAKGVIVWRYCSPMGVNPGADVILDALEKLPTRGKGHAENAHHTG